MSSILPFPFSGGYVSTGDGARSPYDLDAGELVSMQGAYYRKNDPTQPWKMAGRSLFGAAGSGAVNGLAICQFDEGGIDRVVALMTGKIASAPTGTTGMFTDLITGLNSSANVLTACHQDDRWYLGNGYDKNKVLRPDGTTRDMGMVGPQVALTSVVTSSAGIKARPTASTGGFTNPTLAYDATGTSTYSSGTLATPGTITHTWSGWAADLSAGRSLYWNWALAGLPLSGDSGESGGGIGTGGTIDSGYSVTYSFEKSEDGGATWATLYTTTTTRASAGELSFGGAIDDTHNSSLVKFRATMTYNSGTNPATLRVSDLYTKYGSTAAPFDTSGTMYYSFVYHNDADNYSGPPSEFTEIPAFVAQNLIALTRTETPPADATHWTIYRTVPGAAKTIDSLGMLKTYAISQTTVYDTFETAADVQLTPVLPAMTVGDLSIPRDTPPPAFISMTSWKGSVCGFSRTNRRAWRYSEAGLAESFPEFYVVSSFPLPEHDGLVGQMPVGETMVLLCEGAVLAVDDTPRVVQGEFNGANARPLAGHPGCVGEYAYTTWSVSGEPRGAWVSPFGVYITNGQICACISTDLAWEREVNVSTLGSAVLRWDQKNLILWFEFDSDGDGVNDREMPFHMAQTHSKGTDRPKLGQPTPKATNIMAAALIGTASYRYSGHPSNGSVYLEESGYADAATGHGVEMILRTAQVAEKQVALGIVKAILNHSNFGTGEAGTVTVTTYRDSANTNTSRTQTIRLDGNRGTMFGVGRAGEAVDWEVRYGGSGIGGIGDIEAEVEGQGRTGSASRWASVSATP